MRKVTVFENITLNGFFADANGDMQWAHDGGDDAEFAAFVASNASGSGTLIFGRITYDMMVRFWPTDAAMQSMPEVAKSMNASQKLVFSRTLGKPDWENTRVVNNDPPGEIHRLKTQDGPGIAVLGSGSIAAQLAAANLVDDYQFVVNPIVLSAGKTLFEGVDRKLKLVDSRAFKNGKTFLRYEPRI
jgi:dihydrofolate reductase